MPNRLMYASYVPASFVSTIYLTACVPAYVLAYPLLYVVAVDILLKRWTN